MIRIAKAAVATSVQDGGRRAHRAEGFARSGAMDLLSLTLANRVAGASPESAGIEFGPGAASFEITADVRMAFGGAQRDGAPWWETIEATRGTVFELSAPRDGVWSYLAVGGGAEAPVVLGSRSTNVREEIGRWLTAGDVLTSGADHANPVRIEEPPMHGEIRLFGKLPGHWRTGLRADRMGYVLEGEPLRSGTGSAWSEPLLPGFIQVPPGGLPIVLMAEGPTVGGYPVPAVVHSEDVRLVAQSPPGTTLTFVSS
ncbi:MAG: biotin-dependent carboxyltransferase family protein [Actinomycetota bacterium]